MQKEQKVKCLNCDRLTKKDTKTHLCVSCCKIGNTINLGRKRKPFTEEWKIKIGKAAKGNKYSIGRKATESTKEKMSLAKKGKKPANFGINFGVKGKPLSLETRKKLSISHRGGKNYSWKGGVEKENKAIRKSFNFKLWRESVFKRDNWTCRRCNISGGVLHPHHIFPFSESIEHRFNVSNGVTLCKECHIELHRVRNLRIKFLNSVK